MAVNIAAGQIAGDGGATFETAGGTKVAIFSTPGDEIVAYKTIDGTPSLIGVAQTSGTVHGGGSTSHIAAWIDSADVVHVVAIASSIQTRSIAYNTISDPDGTPAWGTWEEAAAYTDEAPTQSRNVDIDLDSSDKPHVLFSDGAKVHGTTYGSVRYTEKTGASWSTPVEISGGGTVDYGGGFLSLKSGNDGEAVYYQSDNGDAYYNTLTSGSWGSETAYTKTAANSQGVAIDTGGTVRRLHLSGGSSTTLVDILESNVDVGFNTKNTILVENIRVDIYLDGTDRYIFYVDVNDDVHLISNDGGGWTDEGVLQTGNFDGVVVGWGYNNVNNTATIDYLYDDGTDVFWDEFTLAAITTYFQSIAGAITPSGTVSTIQKMIQALAGALTFAGNLKKKTSKNLVGALTFAGAVAKKTFESLAGDFTSSGIVSARTRYSQALEGALTFSGTLIKKTLKSLVGSVTSTGIVTASTLFHLALDGVFTPTGTIAKKMFRSLAGAFNSSGIVTPFKLAGIFFQAVSGALTSSGTVVKKTSKNFVGSITESGEVIKKTIKSFVGSLTSSGTVIKKTAKSFVGSLTSSGAVIKKTAKNLIGSLTSTGIVSTLATFRIVLGGALTPSGILVKKILKNLVGSITATGFLNAAKVIAGFFQQSIGGSLASAGELKKKTSTSLAGIITSSGTVAKKSFLGLIGSLTSSGALTKKTFKSFVGAFTSSGVVTTSRGYLMQVGGALAASGTLVKKTSKTIKGTFSGSGTLIKKTAKRLVGVATSVGSVVTFSGAKIYTLLTLPIRVFDLQLPARSFSLSLRSRIFSLIFGNKDKGER